MRRIENLPKIAILFVVLTSAAHLRAQVSSMRTGQGERSVLQAQDSVSCWFLFQGEHPGEPGRWLRTPLVQCRTRQTNSFNAEPMSSPAIGRAHCQPAVRGGDWVLIEGHSAIADMYLRAQALGPACPGEGFRARLHLGGAVVPAVAVSQGHAVLTPGTGVRP